MDRNELLYDHYKDTCYQANLLKKTRNKVLAIIILIQFVMVLSYSELYVTLIKPIFVYEYQADITRLQFLFLMWVLYTFLYTIYLYYTVHIHKYQKYIDYVENKVNNSYDYIYLYRENTTYNNLTRFFTNIYIVNYMIAPIASWIILFFCGLYEAFTFNVEYTIIMWVLFVINSLNMKSFYKNMNAIHYSISF